MLYNTEKLIPENFRLPQKRNRHAGSGCATKARPKCHSWKGLSGWFVPRPAFLLNRRRLIRAAAAECDTGGRRSGFARLVLSGRFGRADVGAGHRPFLLPLQLLVGFGLFGPVALSTLKTIIRFAHQQSPDDFELRSRAPFVDTRLAAASAHLLDQYPSRSSRLRIALRYRRTASALSRTRRSDGFS